MKKILVLIILLQSILVNGNSNVTIFSNTGLRFWIIINGEKINKTASERVEFNKKSGDYKVRIIVENQPTELIDDRENFSVTLTDNFDHLFDVTTTTGSNKKISLKAYKFVNSKNLNGKWKLMIDGYSKKVLINVLESGELEEQAEITITDKKYKNIIMQGQLNRVKNTISINKITNSFLAFVTKETIFIGDGTNHTGVPICYSFNSNFNVDFYLSNNKGYTTKSTDLYYNYSNHWPCNESEYKLAQRPITLNLTR